MDCNMQADPPVEILAPEYERLTDYVCASPAETDGIALLWRELCRASIISPDRTLHDVVRINSLISYTDLTTGQARTVRLAYPDVEHTPAEVVSVTTVLGAALIGLRSGSVFAWNSRTGDRGAIRIEGVEEGSCGPARGTRSQRSRPNDKMFLHHRTRDTVAS